MGHGCQHTGGSCLRRDSSPAPTVMTGSASSHPEDTNYMVQYFQFQIAFYQVLKSNQVTWLLGSEIFLFSSVTCPPPPHLRHTHLRWSADSSGEG